MSESTEGVEVGQTTAMSGENCDKTIKIRALLEKRWLRLFEMSLGYFNCERGKENGNYTAAAYHCCDAQL